MASGQAEGLDRSLQAEAMVGAGRGALVCAMFGAGWLGWGLGAAGEFTGLVGPVFGSLEIVLVVCAIYAIRKGRALRKQYPPTADSGRKSTRKAFWLVVALELLALALVGILAWRLHRPDLGTDWAAMVVGLHFLPLAKLFQSPRLGIIGALITAWCVVCWAWLRFDALTIAVAIGTGALLWLAALSALWRARKIADALRSS